MSHSVSVVRGSSGYPRRLEEIHDPPSRLNVRGNGRGLLDGCCVAVVGARSCSAYGRQVARVVSRDLSHEGVVVVSGLARGIDGAAHEGALEAGGRTVAVLGSGLDNVYPARHRDLARRIERHGLLVSEYEATTAPAPWRFPARNRIIAGVSSAVVVVQARERSGALITADFALDVGREVLAVPGEITSSLSAGTNRLLAQGARPMTDSADVLEAVGIDPSRRPEVATALDGSERELVAARGGMRRSGLPEGCSPERSPGQDSIAGESREPPGSSALCGGFAPPVSAGAASLRRKTSGKTSIDRSSRSFREERERA